jgi:sulfur-oxidizing protein SoxZ
MPEPIRIRATIQDDQATVRVLMSHEMESGQRRDAAGNVIPAHFIQSVVARHNGRPVFRAEWGPAVSKNPYLQFQFGGARAGDKIQITWVDNKGESRTDEAVIR